MARFATPMGVEALGLMDALIVDPPLTAMAFTALAVDSRAVEPGALFVALDGVSHHGARFAPEAFNAGAAAVLTDLEGAVRARAAMGDRPAPMLVVDRPRRRLGAVAARAFPGAPKRLVAVTGTNGKTSVAHFTAQIWAALGEKTAMFGTTGLRTWGLPADLVEPQSHTTLEPVALHALLDRLARNGVTHASMEASSHGLAQDRLAAVSLSAGALTNLSRDHLDYHVDAKAYAAAKLQLFASVLSSGAAAVLNADDPIFPLAAAVGRARGLRVVPVGRSAAAETGVRVSALDAGLSGLALRVSYAGVQRRLVLPLVGDFQASNVMVAAALVISGGADPAAVFEALERLQGVRGRMELVARRANGAGVFVDYAHTPDAVRAALEALRPHTPGRVHVIVGAGGDRDPGKRVLMGGAAAAGADRVLVTDDNPRSEDPAAIRRAVLSGAPEASEIGDRAEAILAGVDGLEPGDALLIAGKGHELGQIIDGEVLPFDDAEQARAAVVALDGDEGRIIGVG